MKNPVRAGQRLICLSTSNNGLIKYIFLLTITMNEKGAVSVHDSRVLTIRESLLSLRRNEIKRRDEGRDRRDSVQRSADSV